MHHAIVCCQIHNCHHSGAIDHYAFCRDVDGNVLAIQSRDHHAIGDVCAHHLSARHVVEQNGRQVGIGQELLCCDFKCL